MAIDKQLRKVLTALHTFAKLKTAVRTNASILANQLHTSVYREFFMLLNKSTKKKIKEKRKTAGYEQARNTKLARAFMSATLREKKRR